MIKFLEKEEDFKKEIQSEIILVDFFATWCGPCKMLSSVLSAYAEEHPDIPILKIDIDQFPNLAREFAIMSVPTLLVFKNGKIEKKELGFRSKEELEFLVK